MSVSGAVGVRTIYLHTSTSIVAQAAGGVGDAKRAAYMYQKPPARCIVSTVLARLSNFGVSTVERTRARLPALSARLGVLRRWEPARTSGEPSLKHGVCRKRSLRAAKRSLPGFARWTVVLDDLWPVSWCADKLIRSVQGSRGPASA